MNPKMWNVSLLLAMLSAIALIGAGVGLVAGIGFGLISAGLAVFVCLAMIQRALPTQRPPERD